MAWGYWISIWASLPAIAAALTGSVIAFLPGTQGNRPVAVAITLGAIWLVVITNLRGVKTAGFVASLTTFMKLVPFGAIAVLGLLYVRGEFFSTLNPSGKPLLAASAALAPLTMFAYLGLAGRRARMPESTRPTTMTVIAVLDWMTPVISVPANTPLSGVPRFWRADRATR